MPALAKATIKEIEAIVRAKGTYANGVLNIEIDRNDLSQITKKGVPIKPAFEVNGNLCFQALPDGSTMLNADLAFTEDELNPAIHQMVTHHITFQAFHQHLFALQPMVYFEHFRGRGKAADLARACADIISVTSTPLPQAPPSNPKTRLDVARLSRIIGAMGTVGSNGTVTFSLPPIRADHPGRGQDQPVSQRLHLGGLRATRRRGTVVVPDFAQLAHQVDPLARLMQAQDWEINCLYNQETDEHPQLYFSHHHKIGDAYALARQVRRGLDLTSVTFT